MNRNQLLRRLRQMGAISFVDNLMFDDNAWFFPTRSGDEYADFKAVFADVFGVLSTNIAIVGSAKYGYSLAPKKNFRQFQPNESLPEPSDLDIVVVSRPLFNETWRFLRKAHYNGAIDAGVLYKDDIFRRFITVGTSVALDTIYLRDLSKLLDKVRKISTSNFGVTQTVKLRIYSSWADVKSYHVWSLQKLGAQHGIQ